MEKNNMDKILLCRLCLSNSENSKFVSPSPEMEIILQKYNILFEKRYLCSRMRMTVTELCELCWRKIDEFNQFCSQVETIQASYNRRFLQENGNFFTFEDQNQFLAEIERVRNEFAMKIHENEDKKFNLEPFCMINVDENEIVKTTNYSTESVIDLDEKVHESLRIKQEYEPNELNGDTKMMNIDILNTESIGMSDLEDKVNFVYENGDDDEDDEDDEEDEEDEDGDDTASDMSFIESRRKRRSKSNYETGKTTKQPLKKRTKKISMTAVNVLDLDKDNERLISFVQMKCDVCSDDRIFDSFSEIQNHFLDIHKQNGYIMCCNRKFRRIGRIKQHVQWHKNPEAFKCDTCKKCFQDNVCLRDHVTSMHIPVNERRFQCDQCSRLFAKQHLLNTHLKMKHTVKEERPFVCTENDCSQRFVLPAYLRLHVEKVHNKSDSRVCDVCARFFKCSKSYERHYQVEHTNIDQRVQCDLCQKWFKHIDTLKDHIRRHYAASATCKYCGRVSSNKKSLRLHIKNIHADLDSSVKTKNEFPCTVCEKIFKKKQTLREHMTSHTNEKLLYNCTFCTKAFRSSANMYAHRKRNHPREYEEKICMAKKTK